MSTVLYKYLTDALNLIHCIKQVLHCHQCRIVLYRYLTDTLHLIHCIKEVLRCNHCPTVLHKYLIDATHRTHCVKQVLHCRQCRTLLHKYLTDTLHPIPVLSKDCAVTSVALRYTSISPTHYIALTVLRLQPNTLW